MSRRGENIYKRKDGRWEGRYIKRRDTSGKIIYGSIYGKTYAQVKERLLFVKAKHLESGESMNTHSGTCDVLIREWLTTQARYQVKATTYSTYSQFIAKHILPFFSGILLTDVRSGHIQKLIFELQEKNLCPGTIRNIYNILNRCFAYAVQNSYMAKNPSAQIELPRVRKKKTSPLSLEQQRSLEKVALKEVGCSPVILALYSGMRIGEISGLRWSDIDFKENIICVNRTVSRITDENSTTNKTKIIFGSPKTNHSSREIPFADNLREYLLFHKKDSFSEYVIGNSRYVVEPRTITNRFKKNIKEAGLADIKFHALRHTFATRCLEKGIDIASLSKILGHQSIKMTLDTYTDSMLETRKLAMKTIDQMFCSNS